VFARLLLPGGAAIGEAGGPGTGTAAEDERALADKLKEKAGVAVVPGSAFGGWESWGEAAGGGNAVGWFRITVAVPPDVLREGLARIGRVLLAESSVSSSKGIPGC
jgi:aspartate/methionine/tyrosine aminotransferase